MRLFSAAVLPLLYDTRTVRCCEHGHAFNTLQSFGMVNQQLSSTIGCYECASCGFCGRGARWRVHACTGTSQPMSVMQNTS
jgi:hypothetical protein